MRDIHLQVWFDLARCLRGGRNSERRKEASADPGLSLSGKCLVTRRRQSESMHVTTQGSEFPRGCKIE